MTQSTEQEIAAAWNAQADELNQWDELDLQEKIEWAAKFGQNQAARRAQVVPERATPEMIEAAESVEDLYKRGTPDAWCKVWRAMLAAAPQPPEQIQPKVCKTEIQTIGCNEAAPVQLPEPKFTANKRGRLIEVDPLIGAFDLKDGGYVLYTEQDLQQVRQLLASTKKPE